MAEQEGAAFAAASLLWHRHAQPEAPRVNRGGDCDSLKIGAIGRAPLPLRALGATVNGRVASTNLSKALQNEEITQIREGTMYLGKCTIYFCRCRHWDHALYG